jgi:hypothetical protein
MSERTPDPEPEQTPGLDPGGSNRPGDTPPAEGGLSGTGPQETYNPVKGWAAMPLTLLAIIVVLFIGFFVAYAVLLMID